MTIQEKIDTVYNYMFSSFLWTVDTINKICDQMKISAEHGFSESLDYFYKKATANKGAGENDNN